jgi:Cytochrome b(C-terminal)/b6/petD
MHTELTLSVQHGLVAHYVICALLNLGFAWWFIRQRNRPQALLWVIVAAIFAVHAFAYLLPTGKRLVIPESVTHGIDAATNAVSYFVLSTVAFILLIVFRKQLTHPITAWAFLNLVLLAFGWSLTNPDFRSIVAKEDNVPIVMMIATVGFFTWVGLRRTVVNDDLIAQNKPPLEKDDDKVLVWPDLVYTELLCMIICTAALIVWAILLKAPLEQPATSAKAPNPSKAPWYFLGLQEMLVYFDPWMAGVVLPTMIIVGLCAMPYIDFNQKGNGYFTFKERPFALATWMYGFLVLWVVLIVLGTFLRGPNWNFFGPFETWDAHKVVPLNNVNLSELFWLSLGQTPETVAQKYGWFVRELPGIALVLAYLILLPPILAKTVFRNYFIKMGFVRYMMLITLLQFMAALPIKMVLRWTMNLKYIVYIPEYFFNI